MTAIPGYGILDKLGEGGAGTVYKAVQEELSRVVAIKVLTPGHFAAEEGAARFHREATTQASLSHPSLLKVYDAGESGGSHYLVMEYVEGGNLRQVFQKEGVLPLERAVRYAVQIAAGLAEAHGVNIVHRDLKPENVLLTTDDRIKLADFGLAKQVDDPSQLTAVNTVMGTPGYIAPEVLLGKPYEPGADLYALGVMLYEMIAGERPFTSQYLTDLLKQQIHSDPAPLSHHRSGLPPALERLVGQCISRHPDERPDSAALLERRLRMLKVRGQPLLAGTESGAMQIDFATDSPEPSGSSLPVPGGRQDSPKQQARKPSGRVPVSSGGSHARPSAPVKQAGNGGRLLAGLVLLCGLALSAILLRTWRGGGGSEIGHTLPATPPAAVVVSPRERVAIRRITVSGKEARIWLDGGALKGTEVAFWPRGTSSRSIRSVPEGSLDVLLRGLVPVQEYEGELRTKVGIAGFHFRTSRFHVEGNVTIVATSDSKIMRIAAAAAGDEIRLLWARTRGPNTFDVALTRSDDGGQTWGDPTPLSEPAKGESYPFIQTRSGVWVASAPTEFEGNLAWQLLRRTGPDGRWSPLARFSSDDNDRQTFMILDDGRLMLASGSSRMITWMPLQMDPGAMPADLPPGEASLGKLQIVRAPGDRYLAVGQVVTKYNSRTQPVFWTSLPARAAEAGRAVTSPLVQFEAAGDDVAELGLAATSERAVLVCQVKDGPPLCFTATGSGDLIRGQSPPLPQAFTGHTPVLAVDGQDVLLAVNSYRVWPPRQEIMIFRLPSDSDSWNLEMRLRTTLADIKDMELLPLPDRLIVLAADRSLGVGAVTLLRRDGVFGSRP